MQSQQISAASEQESLCKTCRQKIEQSRFKMHVLGCQRQNFWCETCNICLPKEEKDEHDKNEHVDVKCDYCNFQSLKSKIKEHQDECDNKPQPCKFCEKVVSQNDLVQHLNICGSKTELCKDCGEYVIRLEMREHKSEGYCDVIKISKQELAEKQEKKEKEEFQQKLLQKFKEEKDNSLQIQNQQEIFQNKKQSQKIQTQKKENKVKYQEKNQNQAEGELNEYEKMLIQQFGQDNQEFVGFNGDQQIMDPYQKRKADSQKQSQLIGGDDDDEQFPYFQGNFQSIKSKNVQTNGPLKLQKNQNAFGNVGKKQKNGIIEELPIDHDDESSYSKQNQAFDDNFDFLDEFDDEANEDIQRAIELSKQFK